MIITPASYLLAFSRIATGFVFALSGFAKLGLRFVQLAMPLQ